jgi:hypothetical protein
MNQLASDAGVADRRTTTCTVDVVMIMRHASLFKD